MNDVAGWTEEMVGMRQAVSQFANIPQEELVGNTIMPRILPLLSIKVPKWNCMEDQGEFSIELS